MRNIGHNKAPHQLETIKLDGIPVTLYKRADIDSNSWHMRIKVPKLIKNVRESTKTNDLNKAKEIAMERYFEIKLQIKNDIPVFRKTFGDIAKELIKEKENLFSRGDLPKKRTNWYKSTINRFYIRYFGKMQIASINQDHVNAFWEWRRDYWKNNPKHQSIADDHTPKPATLHSESIILSAIFDKAIAKGIMKSYNKPDHKPPVKNVKGRRSELSRDEYKKLSTFMRSWMLKDHRPKIVYARARLYYLIKIAVNSGMRVPEIYNLKWEDCSTHSGKGIKWTELNVQGKNKKHTIQCKLKVFDYLMGWKETSRYTEPSDYVFANDDGIRIYTVNKSFKKLLKLAGIPLDYQGEARTLYSLRHTYATFKLRSGVRIYDLADNMDTKVEMIEEHYGHIRGPDRAKAMLC